MHHVWMAIWILWITGNCSIGHCISLSIWKCRFMSVHVGSVTQKHRSWLVNLKDRCAQLDEWFEEPRIIPKAGNARSSAGESPHLSTRPWMTMAHHGLLTRNQSYCKICKHFLKNFSANFDIPCTSLVASAA